jgi:hypothetical protein
MSKVDVLAVLDEQIRVLLLDLSELDGAVSDMREARAAVAELVEDRARFDFQIERGYIVRKLSDTGLWMLLDRDSYPVTGGEHDTAREAIDERRAQLAAIARVQGAA